MRIIFNIIILFLSFNYQWVFCDFLILFIKVFEHFKNVLIILNKLCFIKCLIWRDFFSIVDFTERLRVISFIKSRAFEEPLSS